MRILHRARQILFDQIGYPPDEISYDYLVRYMYRPVDPSSLAVSRMLFGLLMMLDIPDERGGAEMDARWGDPKTCYFPLFPQVQPLCLPAMGVVYAVMWLGALWIMLGYKFRTGALLFVVPYWYILLLDKSFWNNHSYLFGLIGILLVGTQANNYLSIDAHYNRNIHNKPVPYWNYFILKYQLMILYFVAGLKKSDSEWLSGYAMQGLSEHWLFGPFKLFMSEQSTDYLIVHLFACLFDLTVFFWMLHPKTRLFAMMMCAAFHLMNIRLFQIGMFPWVCLATMPLFCPYDWPKTLVNKLKKIMNNVKIFFLALGRSTGILNNVTKDEFHWENALRGSESECNTSVNKVNKDIEYIDRTMKLFKDNSTDHEDDNDKKMDHKHCDKEAVEVSPKRKIVVGLLLTHIFLQGFLPYSHFITKGFNNWTNGLYGYSWDMMVHNWHTLMVTVKVVDNKSNNIYFINPEAWTMNNRWTRHGDMVYQYARCLHRNILNEIDRAPTTTGLDDYPSYQCMPTQNFATGLSKNLSIYVDVWCSLNGRFIQRMFDSRVDLLKAKWSPFEKVEWLMPLLTDFTPWRKKLDNIENEVHSWNNYSDVLFFADFPGFQFDNYLATPDIFNISLTVMSGSVFFDFADDYLLKKNSNKNRSEGQFLSQGNMLQISNLPRLHRIQTISSNPSCYMYTFGNLTRKLAEEKYGQDLLTKSNKPKLPIIKEISKRLWSIYKFVGLISSTFYSGLTEIFITKLL